MNWYEFSKTNRERCESPKGFNHAINSWSLSDWMVACLGELGEAANVLKKLNRVRDGVPGNKETPEQLRANLARELADTFIYLDLLSQAAGIDLPAVVAEVFNAKSKQIGSPIRFGTPSPTGAGSPQSWRFEWGYVGSERRPFAVPPGADGLLMPSEAEARKLVTAINAHDDLLAACEEVLPMFRHNFDNRTPHALAAIQRMHAAISNAKGNYSCPCVFCRTD